MSVNLSLILPNECYDIWDNALATKVFYKKIEEIAEYFGGRKTFVENICIHNSDSPDWGRFRTSSEDPEDLLEYSFELPLIHATCLLRQGYWDIWIMSRYSTYFWPYSVDINGHIRSWPREDAFDVARIFGFSEGWICDEYHSWNSLLDEDPNASFEKWCAYGDSIEDAQVHEFDLSIFKGRMEQVLDYHRKYHDLFSECHALVATLEQKYPDYKILSLNRPKNWVLAAKGKELYVLDPTTGERVSPLSLLTVVMQTLMAQASPYPKGRNVPSSIGKGSSLPSSERVVLDGVGRKGKGIRLILSLQMRLVGVSS